MTTFLDQLQDNRPRESSGSKSSNRFEYQKNWALAKIFELHAEGVDYAVLFDYHDDVLLLDSASAPQKAQFYQIKTKQTGEWLIGELVSKGNDRLSKIAKLYSSRISFGTNAQQLCFMSNARYRLRLVGKENIDDASNYNLIRFTDLHEDCRKKIHKAIKLQLNTSVSDDDLAAITLAVSDSSITGHMTHTIGCISLFFSSKYPEHSIDSVSVYRVLKTEVDKRNSYEWSHVGFSDVLRQKSLSRSQVDGMISEMLSVKRKSVDWPSIETNLLNSNVEMQTIRSIKREFTNYEVRRMNQSDIITQRLRQRTRECLDRAKGIANYNSLVNVLYGEIMKYKEFSTIDEFFCKACILAEYQDA